MQDLKVTCIQTSLYWENRDANLKMLEEKIARVISGTDLIILPEMFTTGFSMRPELFAETPGNRVWEWMHQQARQSGAAIGGSVMTQQEGRYVNCFIWMQPDGVHYTYNKRHLFRMGEENNHYSGGHSQLKLTYKGWNIVPMVCYDLRFPVWCRHPEADLMLFVANWPERRNEHWKKLLEARAIENQCYVIGVNRVGQDGKGVYHSGDSMVVDAKGNRLAYAVHDECLLDAVLSFSEKEEYRKIFPAWKDADQFTIGQ